MPREWVRRGEFRKCCVSHTRHVGEGPDGSSLVPGMRGPEACRRLPGQSAVYDKVGLPGSEQIPSFLIAGIFSLRSGQHGAHADSISRAAARAQV